MSSPPRRKRKEPSDHRSGCNTDDDDVAAVLAYSYATAQEETMHKLQQEKAEISRAINASLCEADEEYAKKLHEQELSLRCDTEFASALEASERDHANQTLWQQFDNVIQDRSDERQQGAWDCSRCSFLNPPYTQQCEVCDSRPPPNVLSFKRMPSGLRFGVELEIVLVDGQRDGFSLVTIAKDLTALLRDNGVRVVFAGYSHETMDCWKIVTDASISSEHPSHDLCFELVSPVLCGEEGLKEMRAVMASIRKLGIATNSTCGFHVHVDATQTNLSALKRICQCFCALENAFDLLVARSWDGSNLRDNRRANGNRYCRSNRLAFGEMSNRQRWNRIDEARTVWYLVQRIVNPDNDRYRKLNLTNIPKPNRPSTIEFRNHGCVSELCEAEAWVRLVVRFTHKASLRGPTTEACLLPEASSSPSASTYAPVRKELHRLFDLVGCPGLEQYFVVERRLFAKEAMSNEWRCNTCHRSFPNCRSLSQHCQSRGHDR